MIIHFLITQTAKAWFKIIPAISLAACHTSLAPTHLAGDAPEVGAKFQYTIGLKIDAFLKWLLTTIKIGLRDIWLFADPKLTFYCSGPGSCETSCLTRPQMTHLMWRHSTFLNQSVYPFRAFIFGFKIALTLKPSSVAPVVHIPNAMFVRPRGPWP